ncbi:MAG: hypothetical protein D6731_01715 [Planctomycetota bacterium]|nr:MAG: hypothetical protein D6731_01715 [Planctomycetota bacterium]
MQFLPRLACAARGALLAALRTALAEEVELLPVADDGGARAAVGAGEADGALLLAPTADARLRVREGACAVTGASGAEGWLAAARSALAALEALGTSRPKLVAFAGASDLERGATLARREGLAVEGPFPPGEAATRAASAYLVADEALSDVLLALLGRGPEASLALSEPVAWARGADAAALAFAARRLAPVLPRPLLAERDAAIPPEVRVAPRGARGRDAGRCPYCRRALEARPDGSEGRAGPPVACAECGTEHHRDCLAEHGRCTVLGCEGTRGLRLGLTVPVARLGSAAPRRVPFAVLAGDPELEPACLWVEAPFDDPDPRPTRRRVAFELATRDVRRGGWVDGHVAVWAPRPFRVRGGALRLRASLTTRARRGQAPPHEEPILAREASLVGLGPASALGRLGDGVVSLFVKDLGVPIPAGVRRYPFAFFLDPRHPASVENRRGEVHETVRTVVELAFDTHTAFCELVVR